VKCLTPAEYLRNYPENQYANPAGSSWGGDGTYEFWINPSNQDIIPGLHQAADRLSEAIASLPAAGGEDERNGTGDPPPAEIVRQMLRELMLAQASDWPFIIRTGTSPEYARRRLQDHLNRFWALDRMLVGGKADPKIFAAIRQADNIFPNCDPAWFSPPD
jgi:1,4-alpha-glucan branching enzyme